MKRFLCMVGIFIGLMSLSVYAADTVQTRYLNTNNREEHKFTTAGTLDNASNAFVTLVVTNTEGITVDSIMYVDQGVTDANGAFSFSNYATKINPVIGQSYTVKVGVWGRSEPIVCEPLQLPATAPAYSIGGTLSFSGERTKGNIRVVHNGETIRNVEAQSGAYSITMLEPGDYELYFTKQAHLPEKASVTISTASITNQNITLVPGDVNEDKIINLLDIGAVLELFGEESGSSATQKADFLEDGYVNIADLTALINNYGEDRRGIQ